MIHDQDVISICQLLAANGIPVWLTDGWGIDALLQHQSCPHKDLDLILLVDDVAEMRELWGGLGYSLKELWPENRWVIDANGLETAAAFVLHDPGGRELDVHAIRLDERGNGIPAWEFEGLVFQRQDLSGLGLVAGVAVPCLSPEMHILCHAGYPLPDG